MKFKALEKNQTIPVEIYFDKINDKKFSVSATFKWDQDEISGINIEIENQSPDEEFKFEIKKANYCLKREEGLELNFIELHFVYTSTPTATKKTISLNPKLKFSSGYFITNILHFYSATKDIEECSNIDLTFHPKTKKGAIIVGI